MGRLLVLTLVTLVLTACASRPPSEPREAEPPLGGHQRPDANGTDTEQGPGISSGATGTTETAVAALPANELMVQTARGMLGVPYSFGGTEPDGFDCSGLVVYAANSVGISLPRTAREQMSKGIPVARDQLSAGDLVFLRLKRRQLHVGIAVDATHFIHAPSRGGRVRLDSLNAKPYSRAYQTARRIIPATIITPP
jgi:cell wall-associated NlpC family hydrolase